MKRLTALCLSLVFLLSAVSCESKNQSSTLDGSSETVNIKENSTVKLTNHMTNKELQNTKAGELTVFDHEQKKIPEDGVYFEIWSPEQKKDYWSHYIENHPNDPYITEEEIQEILNSIDKDYSDTIHSAFVDGQIICSSLPSLDYDGGELTYTQTDYITITDDSGTHILDENGNEITEEEAEKLFHEVKADNFEECKLKIYKDIEYMAESGTIEQSEIESEYQRTIRAWEAIINKSYNELEFGTTENYFSMDPVWEIDHDATVEIAEFVSEICIYDEELDTNFIVHVTLPPDYNSEKTYPAYVLTDGVWRFGNHPELRKEMENGKAGDALLVSIGYDYSMDGMYEENRIEYFSNKNKEFLDFITDNLMPYLGEQYNIDFGKSTLYGHSLGGTFAHYAVFNSDRYENQPFGNYIIGSPAFWSPGFLPYNNASEYKTEYGYFDRNDTLEKRIFICAGEDEDPVYEEYYGDNDSTLEGVENLMKRLSDYGFTNFECKIYPHSGHYQFIPEMLKEVLAKFYPVNTE
ncbi:MAG: alpha/beta hydrolase-fold protein [Prevotella sp.]|nr:alpha/beta hydrolase-fold protein [Alistipes senegalensis]MCM1357009.1 alpha/beta hydrolase-fold protein [Prevotella sp.]MCM1472620.1 alpha/beta hydrolase-fold protein [Muribaculaceae bacterium]